MLLRYREREIILPRSRFCNAVGFVCVREYLRVERWPRKNKEDNITKENDSWNHSRAYGYDSRIHQYRAAPATAHIPIERDERIDLCHQPIGYKESRESVRENMIYWYAAVTSRYISQSKHNKQNGITILETLFAVSLTSFVRRRLSPNEQTILLIIIRCRQ